MECSDLFVKRKREQRAFVIRVVWHVFKLGWETREATYP